MTIGRRLRIFGIATLVMVTAAQADLRGSVLADTGTLAVFNGTLIDGTGTKPVSNGVVVIENGRITAVGQAGRVAIPPNAQKVDARGGTIMPGVIDPHNHFTGPLWNKEDILSPWLQTGVTTVQDLGTIWFLVPFYRERVATLEQPPRVQFAGPIISPRGGYPNDEWSLRYGVDTVEEARAFVRRLIDEADVDVIKIAIERGYSIDYDEEGLPVLTPEQVAAISEEAHAQGRIVIAHTTDPIELGIAVDNGVDILAHSPVSAISDTALRRAIDKDVVMITTVGAWGDVENRPYYAVKNAVRYWRLGGRLSIGSDYPFAPPSMPVHEFRMLSDGGIPVMDLIVAATKNAAEALGRADDLGTLEVGKIGDVIVVAGNPLKDIGAMANVEAVILEGRMVKGATSGVTPTPVPAAATTTPAPSSTPTAAIALPPTGDRSNFRGVQVAIGVAALSAIGAGLAMSGLLIRSHRR